MFSYLFSPANVIDAVVDFIPDAAEPVGFAAGAGVVAVAVPAVPAAAAISENV